MMKWTVDGLRRWWPAIVWMALIIFLSSDLGSGKHTSEGFKFIFDWLHLKISPRALDEFNHAVRKTAHVMEFAVLAILVLRAYGPTRPFWRGVGAAMLVGVIFAVGTEVIQIFVHSRTPLVSDVFIDIGGVLLGIGLTVLIRRRKQKPLPATAD